MLNYLCSALFLLCYTITRQVFTMKKEIIGYTTGVYDLFHVGHLNILKNAKKHCDKLIVGVSTDEVVIKNKKKTPIIPFNDRVSIVEAIKYVDKVVPQEDYSIEYKIKRIQELKVDVLFVGSDWKGTDKWNKLEKNLDAIGVKVIYLPHTDGVSTTELLEKISKNK